MAKRKQTTSYIVISDGNCELTIDNIPLAHLHDATRHAMATIDVAPATWISSRKPPRKECYLLIGSPEATTIWSKFSKERAQNLVTWVLNDLRSPSGTATAGAASPGNGAVSAPHDQLM